MEPAKDTDALVEGHTYALDACKAASSGDDCGLGRGWRAVHLVTSAMWCWVRCLSSQQPTPLLFVFCKRKLGLALVFDGEPGDGCVLTCVHIWLGDPDDGALMDVNPNDSKGGCVVTFFFLAGEDREVEPEGVGQTGK